MKRVLTILSLFVAMLSPALVLAPATVHAQNDDIFNQVCTEGGDAQLCKDKEKTAAQNDNALFGKNGILTRAAKIVSMAVGVAAIIMVIVGGIKFALSDGDSQRITSARNTIIYALVGVIVAAFAQAIILFVLNKF
jgi:hypothetical protein